MVNDQAIQRKMTKLKVRRSANFNIVKLKKEITDVDVINKHKRHNDISPKVDKIKNEVKLLHCKYGYYQLMFAHKLLSRCNDIEDENIKNKNKKAYEQIKLCFDQIPENMKTTTYLIEKAKLDYPFSPQTIDWFDEFIKGNFFYRPKFDE